LLHKFWWKDLEKPQQILNDENLTIAIRAGTDAYGGDGAGLGDHPCHSGRGSFQNNTETTRFRKGLGIIDQFFGRLGVAGNGPGVVGSSRPW
jgi:hypothetical protein